MQVINRFGVYSSTDNLFTGSDEIDELIEPFFFQYSTYLFLFFDIYFP